MFVNLQDNDVHFGAWVEDGICGNDSQLADDKGV